MRGAAPQARGMQRPAVSRSRRPGCAALLGLLEREQSQARARADQWNVATWCRFHNGACLLRVGSLGPVLGIPASFPPCYDPRRVAWEQRSLMFRRPADEGAAGLEDGFWKKLSSGCPALRAQGYRGLRGERNRRCSKRHHRRSVRACRGHASLPREPRRSVSSRPRRGQKTDILKARMTRNVSRH